VLVLHYGIGRFDKRSGRAVARALDLSHGRFRVLERRGLRSLVTRSRRSGCEDTGISVTSFVSVLQELADMWSGGDPAAPAGGGDLQLVSAPASGDGDVAGARQAGGDDSGGEPADGNGGGGKGPLLRTPFGEVQASPGSPLFVVLLALVLAGAGLAGRTFLRAVR
jgi:hypothetical protein